ncbi:P-loop containing nucleoside triphosphate hydrolase protein [Mycena leptocephala]|nr:P-loop containing nucleoside triphosphate hydrolase protein [Mycena leptocephala]
MSTPCPSPRRRASPPPPPPTRHHGKTPRPRKTLPASASTRTEAQLAAIREELKSLPDFNVWGPRHSGATVLHAATGAGKTGIAAGPHLLPSSKGKVTLMVSPLLSLHEEQVETFKNEFGLKAIAINSAHGGCTKEIIASVVAGEHQIVIISPEMLLTRQFIDGVLRKPEFGTRCLSVFIDEAHCVSHWGDSFCKKYGSIGIICAFLPRAVPIIAVSATLTPRVHQDILLKLRIDPKDYLYVNIGNDRPTVAHVVRAMEHPMNSYRDLDFLVDPMAAPKDIHKAFLYSDDTKDNAEIIDHLNDRVHEDYLSRGLVRPYNVSMSKEYCDTVMQLFRAGIIRILVCTDAAGMGCDLPDIDIVVQWRAPANMSSWIQRLGRSARGLGREGLAVMLNPMAQHRRLLHLLEVVGQLVEVAVLAVVEVEGEEDGEVDLGMYDKITRQPEPEISNDTPGEGLYFYIQSTTCRRAIQATIFPNETPMLRPLQSSSIRPNTAIQTSVTTRQQTAKKGLPVDSVRLALYSWRRDIKKEKYPRALFSPRALLDDDTCERLSSIGPVHSSEQLSQYLGGWARWDALGVSLFTFMASLDIPDLILPPRKRPSGTAAQPLSETLPSTAATPSISHDRPSLPPPPPAKRARFEDLPRANPGPQLSIHPRYPSPQTSASTSRNTQTSVTPGSQTSAFHPHPNYPPHYYPYLWQASQTHPYPQYPATLQTGPVSGTLAGNPYAALMTPSPFARVPSNFSSQQRDLTSMGSNPPPDNASASS